MMATQKRQKKGWIVVNENQVQRKKFVMREHEHLWSKGSEAEFGGPAFTPRTPCEAITIDSVLRPNYFNYTS